MYRDDKIRAAMAAQRLTDEQLAEKIGVSRGTIGLLRAGKGNPRYSTLKSVADALGLSMQELFEPRAEPEPAAA